MMPTHSLALTSLLASPSRRDAMQDEWTRCIGSGYQKDSLYRFGKFGKRAHITCILCNSSTHDGSI